MAILRGFKDQLLNDRRMRNGELSMVDIDGIMLDGNDEMNNYYASIVSSSTPLDASSVAARTASTSTSLHDSSETSADYFALRFGLDDDRFEDANTGLPLDEG